MDIRQHKNYARHLQGQNWIVEQKSGIFYYIKRILFFSIIKIQRPAKINLEHIKQLAKKYRTLQVIIEPNTEKEASELIEKGWKQVSPFIPSKTVILQLTKSEKKLYESFDKDTRYSIRKSESIKINEENDLEKFRKHWKNSVDYKRHVLSTKQLKDLKEIFKKDSLFLAAKGCMSGGIFLVAGEVGYYWYGFVNKAGRKSLAQYKVVWEGIKWAKARGAKYFDMEGIYDERFPLPTWQGFTKFKKGFGGKIIKYPGACRKFYIHNFGKTDARNT